jgi:hypothetical protein
MRMLSSKALALCGLAALLLVAFPALGEAQATVTLTVPDSAAAEAGQDPASFTATRTTDAGTDLNLRVYLQRSGNATTADFGTVNLSAVDVAVVHLTVDDTDAAELNQNPGAFTLARSNQGNVDEQLRVYLEVTGTAAVLYDYDIAQLHPAGGSLYYITLPAHQLSYSYTLVPDFEEIEEGDESAVFTVVGPQLEGHGYLVGAPATGAITIRDFIDFIFGDGFENH